MTIDTVPNGKVQGEGTDTVGQFKIEGVFDPSSNEVTFHKVYPTFKWVYWGTLNNNEVNGYWGPKKGEIGGGFKLYYLN